MIEWVLIIELYKRTGCNNIDSHQITRLFPCNQRNALTTIILCAALTFAVGKLESDSRPLRPLSKLHFRLMATNPPKTVKGYVSKLLKLQNASAQNDRPTALRNNTYDELKFFTFVLKL